MYRGTEHLHWKLAQALIGAAVALETPHNGNQDLDSMNNFFMILFFYKN